MKKIILFILLQQWISVWGYSQANILKDAQIRLKASYSWDELKGSYYFVSIPHDSVFHFDAYNLNKCNVATNQLTKSVKIISQWEGKRADSSVNHFFQIVNGDKISFAYFVSHRVPAGQIGGAIRFDLHFVQLDTNLNITIPDTLLATIPGTELSVFSYINNRYYLGCITTDWSPDWSIDIRRKSSCIILDTNMHIVAQDTLFNYPNINVDSIDHMVVEILPYKGDTMIVALENAIQNGQKAFAFVKDSNNHLVVIDTFNVKPEYFPPLTATKYFKYMPNLVVLPSGAIIAGGNVYQSDTGEMLIVAKLTKESRFTAQNYISKAEEFQYDVYQTFESYTNALLYKKEENKLYMVGETESYGIRGCTGTDNHVLVMCLDTSLNLLWRKFIYWGANRCSAATYSNVCDGRSGIVVTGAAYAEAIAGGLDSTFSFAIRVDSSGIAESINEHEGMSIRNRLEVYPNPTTSFYLISDIYKQAGTYTLINMMGQTLRHAAYDAVDNKIEVADLPTGYYMLHLETKDGEQQNVKLLKE